MKHLLLSIFAIGLLSASAIAQDIPTCKPNFQDAFLNKLEGKWFAAGNIGGDKVGYTISAEWVLNHQFLVLSLADTAAQPQYAANIYIGYNCATQQYIAHWLDMFGGAYSETLGYGKRIGETIEFRFEYPQGPFMNTFVYKRKQNTWEFHSVTKNEKGNWTPFGDIFLEKK